MPKVTKQKKSNRGKDVKCGKCGEKIEVGQEYKKWSKRVGFGRFSSATYFRCLKSACSPRPSELASGRTAELYGISESLEDALSDFQQNEDLPSFYAEIDNVISEAESLRDDMQGGFDNMPEGLQQGETGQLIEERINALDSFIDELNSAKDNFDESCLEDDELAEELDEEEINDEAENNLEDEDPTGDALANEVERIKAEKIAELKSEKIQEIAGEFESISLEC